MNFKCKDCRNIARGTELAIAGGNCPKCGSENIVAVEESEEEKEVTCKAMKFIRKKSK